MAAALRARGFGQSGFHTALYGVPNAGDVTVPQNVTVRAVTEAELPLVSELFRRSLEIPGEDIPENAESNRFLLDDPHWRLYIGYVGDTPAGFAYLHLASEFATGGVAGLVYEGDVGAAVTKKYFKGKSTECANILRE